ncbi:hydrogenase maturation protease [Mycolicibacterium poriferae]|uniref:Peptidase M52 n=1 Tax=Mycolicibacterium poriferae TaxID=39694 RepID=A0A6N4VCG0_9MYCO|nr:hydrogenase maturation protease [Mycolicibacterium poriferae]MCV7265795.1 hydrogenase maturation protease [Mycolicibacterium poriferae]BBX51803.1 peptidase M52 [Mycolicibacterium poriferae]
MTDPIVVAGIGNIFLGDDGFGSEVARQVKSPAHDVRVVDYGIRGMHLAYDLLDGCAALVLIDALPLREIPGTLHVFEADHDSLGPAAGVDAHAMDPASLFASLGALGGTPPHTIVVGCEVADLTEGIGLSPPVAAAVPGAVSAVDDVLASLLAARQARAG